VAPDEAGNLEIAGRYADYLRVSLEERNRASIEGRPAGEALWSVHAARACRRIGKVVDALAHAAKAAELARGLADPLLAAFVRHAQAVALRSARRFDESLAGLKEAFDLLPAPAELPAPWHDALRADFLLEIAETALEAGARSDAENALARGVELARRLRDPRILSWSLHLRGQLDEGRAAALQLAAAHELAKSVGCLELQWQSLWRLAERAEGGVRDDLLWCAVGLLSRLAEPLDPEDATTFWRAGPRRVFLDQAQRRFGATFLRDIMLGAAAPKDPSEILSGSLGFDAAAIAALTTPA
jgi:tetratricopeptide (TPR) repeat protein